MKAGTPCIIEPHACGCATCAWTAPQVAGLIVTTDYEHRPGFWTTLPPVRVSLRPGGAVAEAAVPVTWLHPLRGDPAPAEFVPDAERVLEGVPLQ